MNILNYDWAAWYNMMPPGPSSLHVTGNIDVGNNSDSATLVFDSLERSNPPGLILRIVPRTIFIPRDEGDHEVRLHYSEQAAPGKYSRITIIAAGKQQPVHVIDQIGIAH